MSASKTVERAVQMTKAILECIGMAEQGIPSGHLYAALSTFDMSLNTYQAFISLLKKEDLIKESNYLLTVTEKGRKCIARSSEKNDILTSPQS